MIRTWRLSLCFLCILLLFLCGCHAPQVPEQTTEANTTHPWSQALPMPEHPGNGLVTYDPEREIFFFGCENVNGTIYLENAWSAGLSFLVISKRQLREDSIQVSIPVENAHTYSVIEYGPASFRETDYTGLEEGQQLGQSTSEFWLPYYVYQGYLGVDFTQLGELWQEYLNERQKRVGAGYSGPSEAETAAYNAFVTMRDAALPAFMALPSDGTREFYAYSVIVTFNRENAVDEVFTELTVTIEGTHYSPFTGELHLVPSAHPASYAERKNMTLFPVLLTPATGLYGDGMGRIITHMFTAEEDLTLMEYIIREEQFSVLDVIITIGSNKGNSATFYWDGASPVDVNAGDSVSVVVIFRNPEMKHFSYYQRVHPELVYSVGGQSYSEVTEIVCSSTCVMNYHELYAIIFDGLDMESYYRDYYYPIFEAWRAEYTK